MHALLPLIRKMINVSCRSIYFNTNVDATYYLIKYNVVMNILRFTILSFSLENMILGMLILQSHNIKRSGYAIWYLCRLFFSKLRLFYYISDSKPKEATATPALYARMKSFSKQSKFFVQTCKIYIDLHLTITMLHVKYVMAT